MNQINAEGAPVWAAGFMTGTSLDAVDAMMGVEEETVEIGGREMNTKMTKRGKTTMILCQ